MAKFLGLPDDVARLAIQRLLQCDLRWRAHRRLASRWQMLSILLGLGTAILSSLAAYSVAQQWDVTAIYISLSVAVLAPVQAALSANDRMEQHRSAATTYELLANDLDRYLNLELGPPMWRRITHGLDELPNTLEEIDREIEAVAVRAYSVNFNSKEIQSSQKRAHRIVEYLKMDNVEIPPKEVWAS